MARLLRFLPDPTCAHEPGSVDPPKITLVSLAAVAERAQPLQRTAPSRRTEVQCSGRRRFIDGDLAHVLTPGGPTGPAQPLFRLTRSPPTPCLCPSLTQSNRRVRDPYARWCGRGGTARCPPIPIKVSCQSKRQNQTMAELICQPRPARARNREAQTCRKKAARDDWRSSSMLTTLRHASPPGFLRRSPSSVRRVSGGSMVTSRASA